MKVKLNSSDIIAICASLRIARKQFEDGSIEAQQIDKTLEKIINGNVVEN